MNNTEAEDQCESLQREEYEVLESIFPDCVTKETTRGLLKLEVPIELEKVHTVSIRQDGTLAHKSDEAKFQEAGLTTLPPILLSILLPPLYPLLEPPQLLSVRVTHFWLPNTARLHQSLNEIWQSGEGVLYNWVEYLRTGDFLSTLELAAGDNIQLWHPAPLILMASLKSYESLSRSTQFNNFSYLCSICFVTYKGSKCLQLSCSHTFCRTCLADYWRLCIAEGEVGKVGCADPGCVKEGKEARVDEVARVVTEEEVRRWKWLREKRMYENDPSVVHCPMPFCQSAVLKPHAGDGSNDEDDSNMWARFRQCEKCGYTFCGLCQRLWHGPHTACAIEHSERLALDYLATAEGSAARGELERRYGRANVEKVVRVYEAEIENMEFIKTHTTQCPRCEVAVEKSEGCNHMTCRRCGTHFCYRCGSWLGGDPYAHYSRAGTSCYYKLFDLSIE